MIGKTIAELHAGDHAEISRRVGMDDIGEFVEAVGDHNPIHSDPAFAATTSFVEPIAPGIFTAGLISAVLGTELPGPGVIYLSQTLKFMKPVKPGDTITARVEVLEVITDRNRVHLSTMCTNQRGEVVLSGEAWVMPSRTHIVYEPPAPAPTVALPLMAVQPWAWATRAMAVWGLLGLEMLAASWGAGREATDASRALH